MNLLRYLMLLRICTVFTAVSDFLLDVAQHVFKLVSCCTLLLTNCRIIASNHT